MLTGGAASVVFCFFAGVFFVVAPFLSLAVVFLEVVVLALDLDLLSVLVLLAPFLPFSSFLPLVALPVDLDDLVSFFPVDFVSFFLASFPEASFFLESPDFLAAFFSSAFF